MTGSTRSFGLGGSDFYLIKTDSNGNETWAKTLGSTNSLDFSYSVQQTVDGGYIIAGTTDLSDARKQEIYLIKTDSSGGETWAKTFGGTSQEACYSVQQTADGGYVIVGSTFSYGVGLNDVYLLKINSNGNKIWTRTFGGTNYDFGHSVQQTADGGFIILGGTQSYSAGNNDVYLIKTDSSGNETWAKTFGGADDDRGISVQQTTDGGYIIAGHTKSSGAGHSDVYLIKTDSSGNL